MVTYDSKNIKIREYSDKKTKSRTKKKKDRLYIPVVRVVRKKPN